MQRRKAPALCRGRPTKGSAGADAVLAELAAWSRRAPAYLDSRPDATKPVSVAEVRRHLYRRPLNLRQGRIVVLGWMLSGHVAATAGAAGKLELHDTRTCWTDDLAADLAHYTRRAANELILAMGFTGQLVRRIGYRLDGLEQRQATWGQFDVTATPAERSEARRTQAVSRQENVVLWIEDAVARDATGDWTSARTEEWAAALLVDFTALTRFSLDQPTAAQMHRQAVERVKGARRLGVADALLRSTLAAEWRHQRAGAEMRARYFDSTDVRVSYVDAIRPLVSRQALERLLGWVRFPGSEVGTFKHLNRTHPTAHEPAGNMPDLQRAGTEKLSDPKDVVQGNLPIYGLPAEGRKTIQERVDGDDWVGLLVSELVGLFSWAHEAIYGVPCDSELAQHRVAAVVAAGKLVADEFNGSTEQAAEYMRWVWAREEQREHWRRANTGYGKVLTWRQVFVDRALVTEMRLDLARKAGVA